MLIPWYYSTTNSRSLAMVYIGVYLFLDISGILFHCFSLADKLKAGLRGL